MRLCDGARWVDATSGDFLHVPVGGIHGLRNESGARAEMLLLFAPGAAAQADGRIVAVLTSGELRDLVAPYPVWTPGRTSRARSPRPSGARVGNGPVPVSKRRSCSRAPASTSPTMRR